MDYLSKNVAANLKRIRKSKCMSLDQAAEEINVPLKKIGKMMILSVEFILLNPCSWLCSESGRDCTFAEYNRTGNCRCDGKSLWNLGDGKGYHRRWYVRYCYILELLYDRWFPCIVFYGRILHGSESICKTPSKAQNTGQCTDSDRYPYDDRSFRRDVS